MQTRSTLRAVVQRLRLRRAHRDRTLPAWLLGLVLALSCTAPGSAQQLIANADVATSSVTRNEARLFFTMRLQSWPSSGAVHVFVLPDDDALHQTFAKTLLGLFPYQLRRVWDRQVFSGTGQSPTVVRDEREMIRRVGATPGAIGYASTLPTTARIKPLEVR